MFNDFNEFAGFVDDERALTARAVVPVPGAKMYPLVGPDGAANIAALPDVTLMSCYMVMQALTEAERARCTYDVDKVIGELIAEITRRRLPH